MPADLVSGESPLTWLTEGGLFAVSSRGKMDE